MVCRHSYGLVTVTYDFLLYIIYIAYLMLLFMLPNLAAQMKFIRFVIGNLFFCHYMYDTCMITCMYRPQNLFCFELRRLFIFEKTKTVVLLCTY